MTFCFPYHCYLMESTNKTDTDADYDSKCCWFWWIGGHLENMGFADKSNRQGNLSLTGSKSMTGVWNFSYVLLILWLHPLSEARCVWEALKLNCRCKWFRQLCLFFAAYCVSRDSQRRQRANKVFDSQVNGVIVPASVYRGTPWRIDRRGDVDRGCGNGIARWYLPIVATSPRARRTVDDSMRLIDRLSALASISQSLSVTFMYGSTHAPRIVVWRISKTTPPVPDAAATL